MSESDAAARTPLYDLHLELGARMVPFAGYAMPVQYPAGIVREHHHTRSGAGLFDVSHMGQIRLSGRAAAEALESLVPVDVIGLEGGQQRYALFINATGGILDDLMVTRAPDHLFLVVNAACKQADLAHLQAGIGERCRVEPLADRALLALQGPAAARALARLAPESGQLVFMTGRAMTVDGIDAFVTRSGYTGEDGFEISLPAEAADRVARALLADGDVAPVGLGARDSLRLEAGLCLYGHDIDADTTPVEAALVWALSRSRRADGARPGGYPGAEVIMGQLADGVARKRVGLKPDGRAPVREGTELVDEGGRLVGRVTSGGFGPSVGAPVAMGYVEFALAAAGTRLAAMVRGKALPVEVVRLPFVQQRYYRG